MITSTEMDAFKGVVADNRLLETALLDLIETVARKLISGRPAGDAVISLDNLRRRIELERVKP